MYLFQVTYVNILANELKKRLKEAVKVTSVSTAFMSGGLQSVIFLLGKVAHFIFSFSN